MKMLQVSLLERLPYDILQHIALLGAAPGCAPPADLGALLATCRGVYAGLNVHANPHLYAAIFRLKYGARTCTDSALGAELRQRCDALRRCRKLNVSCRGLRQDLWTLLWMALEDGAGCAALSEARLATFIVRLTECYLCADGDVEPRGDLQALVIWLLCLGLSREDIRLQIPEVRSTLVALLRPFVATRVPLQPALRHASAVQFHPASDCFLRLPSQPEPTDVRYYDACIRSPRLPPPSDAAIILLFALKEAVLLQIPYHLPATRAIAAAENHPGPTAEDYTAFQRAATPLFCDVRQRRMAQDATALELDPWFVEVLTVNAVSVQRAAGAHIGVYRAGALTGPWEGSLMISSCVSLEGCETPVPHDFLCRTPMQCEFSEYYWDSDMTPIPEADICVRLQMGCASLPESTAYHKFAPGEDVQRELTSRTVVDHVLIGETSQDHENAWGSGGFVFAGRVHADGSIVFTRRPKYRDEASEKSEAWVFQGRLHYGNALVGTFRSSSDDDACGVHGVFSLSRRADIPRQ